MGVTVRQKTPKKGCPWWVFITHQGKRKSKKIGDKRSAEAVAARIREQLKLGELNIEEDKCAPLFKDYAAEWFSTHAKTYCKYSTMKSYEVLLSKHLMPEFGAKPIDEIKRRTIKDFLFSKIAENLAPGTVRNIKACLSGIFTSAVEDELVTGNPVARLGKQIKKMMQKKDQHKKQMDPFSREEAQLFLKTAQEYCPRYYPVFLCALRTGLRLSELIGLQPGDIDFRNMFIEVRRSMVMKRVTTPKSGKSRRVDMSPQLAETLKAHLLEAKKETLGKGWKEPPEWLFYNEDGGPLDPDNLRKRYFYRCLEKAGLRHIRFHDLRHSFASFLISQGESLAYVRDQMGHHSIQVTVDIYGHLVPGANRDAVGKLDDIQHPSAPYPHPKKKSHEKSTYKDM